MAMADPGSRHRDALPSISHLDLDKIHMEKADRHRFPIMSGLNISTAPLGSPTTIYSGPPPPYSYTSSVSGSAYNLSGYISPPESTRRSTREEKESPTIRKSLPSIHEALGEKTMPYSNTSIALTPSAPPTSTPSAPPSAAAQSFPDPPQGPRNPFSQSVPPPPATNDASHVMPAQPYQQSPDVAPPKSSFTAVNNVESRSTGPQSYGQTQSPRFPPGPSFNPGQQPYSESYTSQENQPLRSPPAFSAPRSSFTFQSQYNNPHTPVFTPSAEPFHLAKPEEQRFSFHRNPTGPPYGDSVKRHLDVFDTELALNEIVECSSRTLEFSRIWSQRSHQSQQRSYFPEVLPSLQELDEMLVQSNRLVENFGRIREVVIAQQNAISEQHARAARGQHYDDDFAMHDEYKTGGGFANGDAKKRRGKAAPPGRCHSCNRAETPEWRRGPDGARTLCNACGLHYAKLTRKMGVTKAAALTGSNLRPKNPDA